MAEIMSYNMFGSHGQTNGSVMIAEDDPTVREEVRVMLQEAGYDVVEVENGEKAIEAISAGENPLIIDTIITDIDNPKGMEAIAYFKNQHPRISLIALTGLPEPDRQPQDQIKIVILGGGKGGMAFLGLLRHLPGVEIVGITDKDPSAPALTHARALGIPVSDDPVSLIAREDTNLIVDVTGAPAMEGIIAEHKPQGAEVLGGTASKLLWNVVQHEAQMQSQLSQTEKLAGMVKDEVIVNYLSKPVKKPKLRILVRQAMEKREIARL